MAKVKLPKPDPEYGHYTLPCGSRIYRAGNSYDDKDGRLVKMRNAGRWFLWVSVGKASGFIPMTSNDLRYLDTPQEALDELEALLVK